MASINSTITIKMEYRPCIVKRKNALFHTWIGGQVSQLLGVIEYEDGTVHECYPNEIVFVDDNIKKVFKECIKDDKTIPRSIKKFIESKSIDDILDTITLNLYEDYELFCNENEYYVESKCKLGQCICKHFNVKSIPKRYGEIVCKTYTKI